MELKIHEKGFLSSSLYCGYVRFCFWNICRLTQYWSIFMDYSKRSLVFTMVSFQLMFSMFLFFEKNFAWLTGSLNIFAATFHGENVLQKL